VHPLLRKGMSVLLRLAKSGKTIAPSYSGARKTTAWLSEHSGSYSQRSLAKPLHSQESIPSVPQKILAGKGKGGIFRPSPDARTPSPRARGSHRPVHGERSPHRWGRGQRDGRRCGDTVGPHRASKGS
jgi:hypothetical protein